MKINNLKLVSFRAIKKLEIQLGSRLTLLIGENGSGKTTILDALAIGLGAILSYLPKSSGISFRKTDIRQINGNLDPYTRVEIKAIGGLKWDRTDRRDKSKNTTASIPPAIGLHQLRKYLDETIINPSNESRSFQMPVFCYYGVSRALLDVPLRRRGFPKTHQRFEALDNALNAVSRFKSSFVWFYNKENEEQRKKIELKDFGYKLPELEVVRKAISRIFPDITEPHIMLNPLRFAVKKDGEVLDIAQLSDGYKTLLSLVIDLASRMAIANPENSDPLSASAVVLIDEIDLHLHPEWQRRVIGDLLNVFINAQFILTTHSPFIVEAINLHLQRYKVLDSSIKDANLKEIQPVSPEDVVAYSISDQQLQSLLDKDVNLLDDRLIQSYNKLSGMYDQLRDIQWEYRKHD